MANISVLDIFTIFLQIFGLQCFSLRNLEKSKGKFPSKFFQVVVMILLTWGLTFGVLTYEQFMKTGNNENYLNVTIKFINYVNYIGSILVSLAFTSFKHAQLVKFFLDSLKISFLCNYEFNYKVDYRRMRKKFIPPLVAYMVYFVLLAYNIFTTSYGKPGIMSDYIFPFLWLTLAIFIQMIVFRFYFYVHIVNFQLEILGELIRENFCQDLFEPDVGIVKQSLMMKISPNKYQTRRKTVVLKKIYFIINEMADCVNNNMGLIIMMRLLMVITNILRFGYEFLSDISGSVASFSGIWCKGFENL